MSRVAVKVSDDLGVDDESAPDIMVGKIAQPVEKYPAHVLVVDDEPLIRWSVSESLAAHGYAVEEAPDAASALKIVTTTALPLTAIVLDLQLPDMSDLSLLATLRQVVPKAHLILMTAFGTPEVIAHARSLGADVIAKPFELEELNRLVQANPPGTH